MQLRKRTECPRYTDRMLDYTRPTDMLSVWNDRYDTIRYTSLTWSIKFIGDHIFDDHMLSILVA